MPAEQDFEAVVIGAGVSGLAAAARLAREGARTLLIEQNAVPGGRCGLRLIDGCYFDIGALYIGSRGIEILREEFGETLNAQPAYAGVRWGEKWITLPPGVRMLFDLLRCGASVFDLARFCLNLRHLFGERIFEQSANLAQVVTALTPSPVIQEVLFSGLGVSGVSPSRMPPHDLRMGSTRHGTQIGNPVNIQGGNGQVAQRLLEVFTRAGGTAWFNRKVNHLAPQNRGWILSTGEEQVHSRTVISTTGVKSTILELTAPDLWPQDYARLVAGQAGTLEVVNLFVQFSSTAGLPGRYNIYFLPMNVLDQFDRLMQGKYPYPPMFVCQISGRKAEKGQTTGATIQFYHPAAPEAPAEIEKQVNWVLGEGLDRLADGLSRKISSCQVYPPSRYIAEFGMRPYVFGVAPLANTPRFINTSPCPGLFLAGDSVEPERPSVPQAMESGLMAARSAVDWLRGAENGC